MTEITQIPLEKLGECKFRIPQTYKSGMRVPGIVYTSEKLLNEADTVIGYRIIILDDTKQTEVQIEMDEGNLNYLKHAIDTL